MTDSLREFHRPESTGEAMRLLRRAEVKTTVLMLGPRPPETLLEGAEAAVDLGALGLEGVTAEPDGGLRIGALTTLQALAESEAARGLAGGVLAEAAHLAAGSALRQAATVGGAVQQHLRAIAGVTRDGPPEVALALLVMEARVVVEGSRQEAGGSRQANGAGQKRELGLGEYFATVGMLAMDELLVEIKVPGQPAGARGALARVARTPRDQAIVAAAALRGEGEVRVALAGATPRPVRMTEVEAWAAMNATAMGAGGTAAMNAAAVGALAAMVEAATTEARGDFRASAAYRRAMAGVVVRRVVERTVGVGRTA
jgi:CO/xanthine dehydrogenase FAD-binding subunit